MRKSEMPVVILCGGKGTRIRNVSELLPKPMLKIGQRPILWHIMRFYYAAGFRKFILCLGYKGDYIRDYFLNYNHAVNDITLTFEPSSLLPKISQITHSADENFNWEITLLRTGLEDMTGSRVMQALKHIDTEYFMLTYGDGLSDVDLDGLLQAHVEAGTLATITGVKPAARFGKLSLDGNKVTNFAEKPQTSGEYISGGFMCLSSSALPKYLTNDSDQVLEVNALPRLAEDGQMQVFKHDGFWMPMDNPTEYEYLNNLWNTGRAPWKTW